MPKPAESSYLIWVCSHSQLLLLYLPRFSAFSSCSSTDPSICSPSPTGPSHPLVSSLTSLKRRRALHPVVFLYVSGRFSPASLSSPTSSLFHFVSASNTHSLNLHHPSLSEPFLRPPTPRSLLLLLRVNLPSLLPSRPFFLSGCSCITYHPDLLPHSIIGVCQQQMQACFI